MNRLILIGNGFDLAHKLKTSYCDFITDYISNSINSFFKNHSSVDPLIEIKYKFAGNSFSKPTLATPETALYVLENLSKNDYSSVNVKSKFLSKTLKRVSEVRWVDLENDYFEQLLSLKDVVGYNYSEIKKLNIEFDCLKNELQTYLFRQNAPPAYSEHYSEMFCEPIRSRDIVTMSIQDQPPQNLLILNFNYTQTLERYRSICSDAISTQLNYIHGKLNDRKNPIIFGFGDEYNKSYLEFEDLKNNELFKHIKSFAYFKTTHYHDLIRFTWKTHAN